MNLFQEIRRKFNNWVIRCRIKPLTKGRETIDLWLDDMRPAPLGWYHATTYEEAALIYWLYYGNIRNLALDHDLGQKKTGYDFVKLMVENARHDCAIGWPEVRPFILTSNPVGRDNMQQLIDRYGPYKKYRPI